MFEAQMFKVDKFLKQSWLCSSIAVREKIEFLSHRITTARFGPVVYELYLNADSHFLLDSFEWFVFTITTITVEHVMILNIIIKFFISFIFPNAFTT